jgi:predicted dehydrogenase
MSTPSAAGSPAAITRRAFIGRTAATLAAGLVVAPYVNTRGQVLGANDRIGIGFIGAGGRAEAHMHMVRHLRNETKEPLELVAVCDAYRPRRERRKNEFGIAKAYAGHRELLADPDVDLVCIATPDHVHGRQAIDAVEAGKDVYCEKPVTHWRQFDLTKKLADAVAKSGRVFQLGTQGMSDSAWHQMKQLVKEGLIGRPIYGETGFFRVGDWGERGMPVDDPNARPGPDLDWEAFLGEAPRREFSVDRFFRWRLFEDYAGGPATDLYPHCLTQVVDILGVGMPSEVVGMGSVSRYPYELREVPDTFSLIAQYPEQVTIAVLGTQGNDFQTTERRGAGQRQPVIRGWEGSLTISKNRDIVFTPIQERGAKAPQSFPIQRAENNTDHWKNLLDNARAKKTDTWSPMDLALRTQAVLQMAMKAWKEGRTSRFNPETKTLA